MKISSKIIVLVSIFLGLITLDGLAGSRIMTNMASAFRLVVNRDAALVRSAAAITRDQMQKAVVFERLRRIIEELAYQQVTPARREHLLFHVRLARRQFDALEQEGAQNIIQAKTLLDERLMLGQSTDLLEILKKLLVIIKEIEKAHIHYDSTMSDVFKMVDAGQYEISPEVLAQIQRDEKKLSGELQKLMDEVSALSKASLLQAQEREVKAKMIFWGILGGSIFLGLILMCWIILAVDRPLKTLAQAAHEVGAGNLDFRLKEFSNDEIGEVSRAFNKMAGQLTETKERLEEQSNILKRNLEITEQQKKDLEKANRELDRFVQTVSHDIRSPLMGIAWYAEFLKGHYYDKLDEKGRDCLDGVMRGVDRSNALIRDLLALTRISRIQNPYTFVQIGALVDEVVGTLEYRIKQNKVDVSLQPNMPAIICDGIKMKEVFLNLMTNAIKFSSGNPDRQPRVEFRYIEHAKEHEFVVKDNGIGIAPEHFEEIFGIFKRLDTSGKYEGTGVGLGIVKSVIDDHGGRIWLESDVGKGSAFHFTIPKGLEIHSVLAA